MDQSQFKELELVAGKLCSGTYTRKVYRSQSKAPSVFQKARPLIIVHMKHEAYGSGISLRGFRDSRRMLECVPIYEDCRYGIVQLHYSYIISKTKKAFKCCNVQNPKYMKKNFQVIIESMHVQDNGHTDDVLFDQIAHKNSLPYN